MYTYKQNMHSCLFCTGGFRMVQGISLLAAAEDTSMQ